MRGGGGGDEAEGYLEIEEGVLFKKHHLVKLTEGSGDLNKKIEKQGDG